MTRITKHLGLLALGLSLAAAAHAQVGPEVLTQRIVVFKESTSPAQRVSIATASGAKVTRELGLINAVVIAVPSGQIQTAEGRLRVKTEVLRIDDDPRINWLSTPATLHDIVLPDVKSIIRPFKAVGRALPAQDPSTDAQATPWGITRVNAPAAWAVTRGDGVKLVVIDTGIDYDHPELKPLIAGGWNATNKDKPADFKDDNGHGTHVSGTIAAVDNEAGVVGVAPKVALYGVKVLDANGSGTFSDVIAGMQWAVDNKMQIASMSLGASRGNDSLKAAVEAMVKGGVVLIAAAGNSGGAVGFPAAYPGAIAIAASDKNDKVASFSSRGPEVALLAPGVDVNSTYMGGGYSSLSGTSMATPHVAGLAALAIAAKGLSGDSAVRAALKAAATPLAGVPPAQQGAGIVDAAKLVK